MSVNRAWRRLFSEKNHRFLSEVIYLQAMKILGLGAKSGVFNTASAQRVGVDAQAINRYDLSETTRFYNKLFETSEVYEGGQKKRRLIGILNESISRLLDQRNNPRQQEAYVAALRTGKELDALFRVVQLGRNVGAHDHREISELGWASVMAGTVLRIMELAEIEGDKGPNKEALWDSAVEVFSELVKSDATEAFGRHSISYGGPADGLSAGRDPVVPIGGPNPGEREADILSELQALNRSFQVLGEQSAEIAAVVGHLAEENKAEKIVEKIDETEPDAGATVDDSTLYRASSALTIEQARQGLQNLRMKIYADHEKANGAALAPAENILQRPIIEAVLAHPISSLEQWKNTPDIGWRYLQHRVKMKPQLDKWWPKIREIINVIERPSE